MFSKEEYDEGGSDNGGTGQPIYHSDDWTLQIAQHVDPGIRGSRTPQRISKKSQVTAKGHKLWDIHRPPMCRTIFACAVIILGEVRPELEWVRSDVVQLEWSSLFIFTNIN